MAIYNAIALSIHLSLMTCIAQVQCQLCRNFRIFTGMRNKNVPDTHILADSLLCVVSYRSKP